MPPRRKDRAYPPPPKVEEAEIGKYVSAAVSIVRYVVLAVEINK